MGGYKVQGRNSSHGAGSPEQIIRDAKALEEAGAFCVVIECVPPDLATTITKELSIPTIGIGASSECDGQVLVSYDLLGLRPKEHRPKFLKQFAQLGEAAIEAFTAYADEVRAKSFPSQAECYGSDGPPPALTAVRKESASNG
jgi:3-methyl-2-oxobutanoate hydroxymethyltransferase